jgi:hypothetical protein
VNSLLARADPTLRVECYYGDPNDFHDGGVISGEYTNEKRSGISK